MEQQDGVGMSGSGVWPSHGILFESVVKRRLPSFTFFVFIGSVDGRHSFLEGFTDASGYKHGRVR